MMVLLLQMQKQLKCNRQIVVCSQFMHQPSQTHWQAVKCLLWYLKYTIHHGLLSCHGSNSSLYVYTDANWADNYDDHTSTSAYIIYLSLTPIS